MNSTNTRRCIHGRTEKQHCALCHLRSECCDDLVVRDTNNKGKYTCYHCERGCDVYQIELEY